MAKYEQQTNECVCVCVRGDMHMHAELLLLHLNLINAMHSSIVWLDLCNLPVDMWAATASTVAAASKICQSSNSNSSYNKNELCSTVSAES